MTTKLTISSSGSSTTLKDTMTEPDLKEEDENEEVWYALKSEKHGGREYYVNPKTNQSTWILPDDDHPNPDEWVATNAEREEDTSHEGDGVEGDQATLHKSTTTTSTTSTNETAQGEKRLIGRSVGFLLCLLAIVAILHVYTLSSNYQNQKVVDTSSTEQKAAKTMDDEEGPLLYAIPEEKSDDIVNVEVDIKPSEEVDDTEHDEKDEEIVSNASSEEQNLGEEASSPDVGDAERKSQESPKDDNNMQESKDEGADSRTGDADLGESETSSFEASQAAGAMQPETAEPVEEEDARIETASVERSTERLVVEVSPDALKDEATPLQDEQTVDQTDATKGTTATAFTQPIELDWDAIRKAVHVPRPPGVDAPATSSTTIGIDYLTKLELELDQAGFEIRRSGPEVAVTLREKGSIQKRGMKRGGWFRLW